MPFRVLSQLAALLLPTICQAAVVLSVDVNDSTVSPEDTAPAFDVYTLGGDTVSIPPFTVDINPASGAGLDDAHNATPANGGSLTLAPLYRDFVFASGTSGTNFYLRGLDAVIGGLIPYKRYTIQAWSYDSASTGARTSDWSLLGLRGPQFGVNDYSFNGSTPPATDTANQITVTGYADENGRLTLRGRPSASAATTQVVLNGFTVDELEDEPQVPTPILALDFNDRDSAGPALTFSGFSEFLLSGSGTQASTTRTYGALTATLSAFTTALDDRVRETPANSGSFTESLLLRDFIFGTNSGGLDCRIEGLQPGGKYLVELWSYDQGSATLRTSDWTVNGAQMWDDYVFNGSVLPATNHEAKMVGAFTASPTGELLISGRAVGIQFPAVFLNALRISQLEQGDIVDFGRPIISEFMAENDDGITDEDGDASDWIEIWNTTGDTLNLEGWRLTDNPSIPARWIFPAGVSVPSQQRLLVWASGKNRTSNPAALHTSFSLSNASGYLALSRPNGEVVSSYLYTTQRANISYGVTGTEEPLTQGYFATPTPNAPNGATVPGFVADTVFDLKRGFYTTPITVHITCATPGATIYYTTDGSAPTTSSTVYPGAAGIPISSTTVLRAKAVAPPLAESNIDTQTYIFRAHVQNQPANPPGWAPDWGFNQDVDNNDGAGNGIVPADYEMDPQVVSTTLPGYSVLDGLSDLPALSVALPPGDFLGGNGMYSNPQSTGDTWERACSIEFLELDGSNIQTQCGIRVHGNASRRPFRMQKHSFRIAFRAEYGDGKLDYKVFQGTTVKEFNKLVLHAFFTDGFGLVSWDAGRYRPTSATCIRDAFMKRSFADMGGDLVADKYVHLYINGLYWGIYKVGERVDDAWCADHFGGEREDWDVIAPGESPIAKNGSSAAWDSLFSFLNAASTDLTTPAHYNQVAAQVDLANFADYYLLHIHGNSEDWPHHNGYAVRNRVVPGAKWRMVTWDQEIAFDPLVNVNRINSNEDRAWGRLLQKMRTSPEFRLLFADRAHKHLNNSGALSVAASQARWQSLATLLDKAIVAESARWGDTADATPYGTSVPPGLTLKRETHWLPEINLVRDSHIPALHNRANNFATITELKAASPALWPNTEPPVFSQFGGNVAVNFALTITAPAGSIYYTVDGSDPREAFTGNAVGTLYAGPIALAQTTTVKARARNGSDWSPLTEARFIVGVAASSANLAVTELNYHPAANEDEEFIELTNFSAQTIDLTDVKFVGLTFEFLEGTLLAPGERIVVVRNQAAFIARYGNGPRIAGQFTGALDNNGEQIAVIAANDSDIMRFVYGEDPPWPTAPDGDGRTLVLRNIGADPNNPSSWRSSATVGGSPGESDRVAFSGSPLDDADGDSRVALLEYAQGGSDTVPNDVVVSLAAIELVDAGSGLQPFLTITTQVASAADDAVLSAEASTDLTNWQPAVEIAETIAQNGTVSRKWRFPVPRNGSQPQFLRLKATLVE